MELGLFPMLLLLLKKIEVGSGIYEAKAKGVESAVLLILLLLFFAIAVVIGIPLCRNKLLT